MEAITITKLNEMSGTTHLKIQLRYVQEFRDRHGRVRRYFRRPGYKRIPLPGAPGSAEFLEAYQAALDGDAIRREVGSGRSPTGSIARAVAAYYQHNSFAVLAPSTRNMRRAVLERLRGEHGEKRVATLQRAHIEKMLGSMKSFAARNWLKTLRGLMQFAVAMNLRKDDPTVGVKLPKAKAGTIHTWSEAQIAQFEKKFPIGSRQRLAMALLLYTAQRRSDVVRLGPQHVRNGGLAFRQQKTGSLLEIPIHPSLQTVLDASTSGHLTFLVTASGKPFTAAGFGNIFRDWCNEAGLPAECSSHGLRKAACRRLAEAGCTEHQIAAISGHQSLAEVRRYTRAARQAIMARDAIATVAAAFPDGVTTGT